MGYVLGIDIGTGSTKAVAINLAAEVLAVTQSHYTTNWEQSGYSEQDPEQVWAAFQKCLRDIIEQRGESPRVISLSSAMHSLIPVNDQGEHLLPMMTWADSRSDGIAVRLRDADPEKKFYRISGMPFHAMSPLCKIIWIRENQPEVFERTAKFISIKEYIWFKLFGKYQVDQSIAGATGMFDLEKSDWNPEILSLAGISEAKLSTIVNTEYYSGNTSALYGKIPNLADHTPFVIGASDGCLANLGSYAIADDTAAVTIGTSGAVRVSSKKPIFNDQAMTFSYRLDGDTFICGGAVNNGGNVLQWLVNEFWNDVSDDDVYQNLFSAVSDIPAGSGGIIFLPYLHGERAPLWDAKSCGTFFGIRSAHSRAHFSKAVLEGICYALFDVLTAIENKHQPVSKIHVSGGFVNSDLWLQLLANITGKELVIVRTEDASAIGAAFLGMKAVGLNGSQYPDENTANRKMVYPDMDQHQLYKPIFAIFKQLYTDLQASMHQLHLLNS